MYKTRLFRAGKLSFLFLFLIFGCGSAISGSGVAKLEQRKVGSFHKIDAGGVAKLEITFGEAKDIEVELDDNLLAHFHTKVEGDTLKITSDNISAKAGPIVRITLPSLTEIELSGACKAKISGMASKVMEAELSGVSQLTFEDGVVDELDAEASGSSRVDAENLELERAVIDVSGTSKVKLGELEQLNAKASGSSEVLYKGDPEVTKDVSGSSKVESH